MKLKRFYGPQRHKRQENQVELNLHLVLKKGTPHAFQAGAIKPVFVLTC